MQSSILMWAISRHRSTVEVDKTGWLRCVSSKTTIKRAEVERKAPAFSGVGSWGRRWTSTMIVLQCDLAAQSGSEANQHKLWPHQTITLFCITSNDHCSSALLLELICCLLLKTVVALASCWDEWGRSTWGGSWSHDPLMTCPALLFLFFSSLCPLQSRNIPLPYSLLASHLWRTKHKPANKTTKQ